MEKIKSVIS